MRRRRCVRYVLDLGLIGRQFVSECILTGDDDAFEIAHASDNVLHDRIERFGDEQHPRAAIGEHIGILIRGQKRIERHRHDAGTDGAQKHRRKIHRVEHDHRDTFFAANAKPAQQVGDAAALPLQIAIGPPGPGARPGPPAGASLVDIAVEQIGHCIVSARCLAHADPLKAPSRRIKARHAARHPQLLSIIIHRKALLVLAVNPLRHYVSGCFARADQKHHEYARLARGMMTSDPETSFLEQLGQRVRTMRALRGMSRKVLAKVSGISERYIAQLESGKGNVSIVLLRRVSNAMGAHLEDLIPHQEPSLDWAVIRELLRKASPSQISQAKDILAGQSVLQQRAKSFAGIALIGLRGAGKSTLGKLLAKKIGWNFVELNKEIEAQNGLSVAEIIALYGQEGFRRMEQSALTQLLAGKELTVLATGGGIVSEPVTFDLILSSFYTIWLKAEPEEHMARVRKQGDLRPMANNHTTKAKHHNKQTSHKPHKTHTTADIDTAGLSADAAAARLI